MIERFKTFLSQNQLNSQKATLIGTSGGRDSMVLCHLYLESNIPFVIAHCNFNLRGNESQVDQAFVQQWAKTQNIPIHINSFNTLKYANKNGISIQMAARDLRLNYFEELCEQYNYEFYATAHHQDDAIETYLINQIRGTGLAGLHGILPKQNKLIHPLLFCTREEINEYAKLKKLEWREDSSNKENKYLRNRVRNQLLPLLSEINPNIKSILQDNIDRLKASEEIYQLKIKEFKEEIIRNTDSGLSIDLMHLYKVPQKELVLYELINEFGFNYTQVSQILDSNETTSGSFVESDTHLLLKNRDEFLIKERFEKSIEIWRIEKGADTIQTPIILQFDYKNDFEINSSEFVGQFDLNKLKFPLFLRQWKKADFFYPLGMNGSKKLLSDYFIDEKLSVIQKNETWLLCSGSDIIWIVGRRQDERYKISKNTTQILEIKWVK